MVTRSAAFLHHTANTPILPLLILALEDILAGPSSVDLGRGSVDAGAGSHVIIMAPLEVRGAVSLGATLLTVELTATASIFGLFIITFFVGANVIPDFLVLFKKEPEHAI